MKAYEKHIIYLYTVSFFKTLLFISSIIISIKTLDIAQSLTEESSIALSDIGLISTHIAPYILYTITPFALTIASFSVFYKLLTHSEIITLQNAGLTNFHILRPHLIVSGICAFIMLYSSAMVIPKTVQIRKNLQEAIIKRKVENFLSPNTVKEIKDITIVTSALNKAQNIAITLIHKPNANGETVLLGHIRRSWEKDNMIGIVTDSATILNVSEESQRIMKFETLEIQMNPFSEYEAEVDLRHLTTPDIIYMYIMEPKNEYISTINARILPSFSAILLPLAISSLLIKFYQNRGRYSFMHIIITGVAVIYILFSCYNLNYTFSSIKTFGILYVNIILTFTAIYLTSKHPSKKY